MGDDATPAGWQWLADYIKNLRLPAGEDDEENEMDEKKGIADELRRIAGHDLVGCRSADEAAEAIYALADRIDSEMIEMPVDADGKPWHMGDRFESKAGTETGTVGVITYECGECRVNYAEPTDLKHYDSPTPASIADELDEAADDAYGSDDLVRLDPDTLREWAKALRSTDDRF